MGGVKLSPPTQAMEYQIVKVGGYQTGNPHLDDGESENESGGPQFEGTHSMDGVSKDDVGSPEVFRKYF